MKTVKQTMLVVLGLLFFALQGCTNEDYIPVPGPAGADGVNGINGINGTTECATCHSKAHTGPIIASFALSDHATETLHETKDASGATISLKTSEYSNRTGCVQCHTSQGYIDKMNGDVLKTGTGTALGFPAYPGGKQAISCTTCHNKHSSFDFKNDGNDFALRQGFTPVVLTAGDSYKMDMGTSNTCVNCHQPRALPPTGTADFKMPPRFGPHYGPQSTLLEGIQGALIVGSTPYPAPKSAKHRTGASCVTCHMGKTTDGKNGAHSWNPTPNACVTCHTGGAPTSVAGFEADMATLQGLLVAKGAYSTTTNSLTTATVPIKVAQAAWNYAMLKSDKSKGVHNPAYAKALLKNSIEALQ
jgi:hypothetical protein